MDDPIAQVTRQLALITDKMHARQGVLENVVLELLTSLPPGQAAAIVARGRHRWTTQRSANEGLHHPDADAEGLAFLAALESAVRGDASN